MALSVKAIVYIDRVKRIRESFNSNITFNEARTISLIKLGTFSVHDEHEY